MSKGIALKKSVLTIEQRAENTRSLASWLVGIGIVFFVWHNPYQPLIQYAFLPWIGTLLLIGSVIIVVTQKAYSFRHSLGQKRIWIPLAIISVSIAMSGILNNNAQGAISTSIMLFGLYIVGRFTGKQLFEQIAPWVVVIESISIPLWGITHGWTLNGGILSPTNYDIATGLVIFFVLVAKKEQQWWLATIGTFGLIFSGSAEAILVGTILFFIVVIRKLFKKIDISWYKILAPVAVLLIIAAITIPTGAFTQFQGAQLQRLSWLEDITGWTWLPNIDMTQAEQQGFESTMDNVLGQRFTHWQISPIKPFGYGINLTHFYYGIPHNIFLIIIEQVGIIALIAWLMIAFQGIRNRQWRYVWVGFLLLGLVDHFIFTQAAPWFWCLTGVTFIKE